MSRTATAKSGESKLFLALAIREPLTIDEILEVLFLPSTVVTTPRRYRWCVNAKRTSTRAEMILLHQVGLKIWCCHVGRLGPSNAIQVRHTPAGASVLQSCVGTILCRACGATVQLEGERHHKLRPRLTLCPTRYTRSALGAERGVDKHAGNLDASAFANSANHAVSTQKMLYINRWKSSAMTSGALPSMVTRLRVQH